MWTPEELDMYSVCLFRIAQQAVTGKSPGIEMLCAVNLWVSGLEMFQQKGRFVSYNVGVFLPAKLCEPRGTL
jgi:hypothetical protein